MDTYDITRDSSNISNDSEVLSRHIKYAFINSISFSIVLILNVRIVINEFQGKDQHFVISICIWSDILQT